MRYTSGQICALTGATYRQLDHWERSGKLGEPRGRGSGNGCRERHFEAWEAVLVRACVLIGQVAPRAHWAMDEPARRQLREALEDDPSLVGWRLVVERDRSYLAQRTGAPAAIVVNLAVCAEDVALAAATQPQGPQLPLRGIADVDAWLAAGGPETAHDGEASPAYWLTRRERRRIIEVAPNKYV